MLNIHICFDKFVLLILVEKNHMKFEQYKNFAYTKRIAYLLNDNVYIICIYLYHFKSKSQMNVSLHTKAIDVTCILFIYRNLRRDFKISSHINTRILYKYYNVPF